jgi:hypothetical protein
MAYQRKSWAEKMNVSSQAKIEKTDKSFADIPQGSTLLIATPTIVDNYLRQIPKGTHTSLQQMRKDLAAEYDAQYTCPITSGIFLRICAEKAYEEFQNGKLLKNITPFWRMIDKKTPAAKKLTFGFDFVQEQRIKEGLER